MDYREYTAKSVGEAITQACLDMAVTSDRLDYKVVQEPTSGFLGIGAKPAVIRARAIEVAEEEPIVTEKVKTSEKAPKSSHSEKEHAESTKEKPKKQAAQKEVKKEKAKEEPKKEAAKVKPENRPAKAEEPKAPVKEAVKEPVKEKEAEPQKEAGSFIVTSDEIEKRAAAAAARAAKGGKHQESPVHIEKRESGRRDRGRSSDRRRREEFVPSPAAEEKHEPSKPKPERVVKPISEEEAEELKKAVVDFLTSVFKTMNIDVEIEAEYSQKDGTVSCVFSGEDMGVIIGKRGQTLDSLQYLASLVVNKKTEEYVRVKLDTEDYRARRAETLGNLARNIAYKVKKTHRSVALEPMNPYERRIIHSALQSNKHVETYSEGEEPYRHVVVTPKH